MCPYEVFFSFLFCACFLACFSPSDQTRQHQLSDEQRRRKSKCERVDDDRDQSQWCSQAVWGQYTRTVHIWSSEENLLLKAGLFGTAGLNVVTRRWDFQLPWLLCTFRHFLVLCWDESILVIHFRLCCSVLNLCFLLAPHLEPIQQFMRSFIVFRSTVKKVFPFLYTSPVGYLVCSNLCF